MNLIVQNLEEAYEDFLQNGSGNETCTLKDYVKDSIENFPCMYSKKELEELKEYFQL